MTPWPWKSILISDGTKSFAWRGVMTAMMSDETVPAHVKALIELLVEERRELLATQQRMADMLEGIAMKVDSLNPASVSSTSVSYAPQSSPNSHHGSRRRRTVASQREQASSGSSASAAGEKTHALVFDSIRFGDGEEDDHSHSPFHPRDHSRPTLPYREISSSQEGASSSRAAQHIIDEDAGHAGPASRERASRVEREPVDRSPPSFSFHNFNKRTPKRELGSPVLHEKDDDELYTDDGGPPGEDRADEESGNSPHNIFAQFPFVLDPKNDQADHHPGDHQPRKRRKRTLDDPDGEAPNAAPHPLQCRYPGCATIEETAKKLVDHVSAHPAVMRFHCPMCGLGIRAEARLRDHINQHTGQRPYVCNVCGRAFSRLDARTNHLKKCLSKSLQPAPGVAETEFFSSMLGAGEGSTDGPQ